MLQSVIPSIYPLIQTNLNLTFSQIGLITFTFQITASLLQPFVGQYTDKYPKPYSLAIGMGFTLTGLIVLSMATGFYAILAAVALVGVGSSIFHPEASRVAHLASGGKRGLAQSIFQLGGNAGSAIGRCSLPRLSYPMDNPMPFGLASPPSPASSSCRRSLYGTGITSSSAPQRRGVGKWSAMDCQHHV